METPVHDLEIQQGATFDLRVSYQEPDESPVNLTGYTARMQVRERVDGRVWANLTSGPGGGLTIDPLTGTVSVRIEASVTRLMPAGRIPGVYDLFLVAPGGYALCLIRGEAQVIPAVTK